MSIGEVVADLFLAGTLVASWRWWHDRTWVIVGALIGMAIPVALLRNGLHLVVITWSMGGTEALVSLVISLLFWAQLLGLPRAIARILGIGLWNPAYAFDWRIRDLHERFVAALATAKVEPGSRDRAFATAGDQIRRMRRVRAPSIEWRDLRNEIASHDAAWLGVVRSSESPEGISGLAESAKPLGERWSRMRKEALSEQRLLRTPARDRRGTAVLTGVFSIALLLFGIVDERTHDVVVVGFADPQSWITVMELGGGGIGIVAAVVMIVRR